MEMEIQIFLRKFSYAIPGSSKIHKGSKDYLLSLVIFSPSPRKYASVSSKIRR